MVRRFDKATVVRAARCMPKGCGGGPSEPHVVSEPLRWERTRRDKASPWTHVLTGGQGLTVQLEGSRWRVRRDGRLLANRFRTLHEAKAYAARVVRGLVVCTGI